MFFGLAPPTASGPVLFLAVPLANVCLVPSAAALVAEVVLACPTGLLSGTLVWLLAEEEAAAAPNGRLVTAPAPAAADFAFVPIFLTASVETLFGALTSFTGRWEVAPAARVLVPDEAADLTVGFFEMHFGSTVATGLAFAFGLTPGAMLASSDGGAARSDWFSWVVEGFATPSDSSVALMSMVSSFVPSLQSDDTDAKPFDSASFAVSSGCGDACSDVFSWVEGSAIASVGCVVSMLTPSSFIPFFQSVPTESKVYLYKGVVTHTQLLFFGPVKEQQKTQWAS